MKPTRRQHYVAKKYLKAWANNDYIYCKMNNQILRVNIINVGLEKDIYSFKGISKESFILIEKLYLQDKHNQAYKNFFDIYKRMQYINNSMPNKDYKFYNYIDGILKTTDENFNSSFENDLYKYLDKLYNRDLSFLEILEERYIFLLVVAEQYFRTKKMKQNLIKAYDNEKFNGEELWFLTKHMNSIKLGGILSQFNIYLLINETNIPFITGDQPVINCKDNSKKEMELFYPISPKLAVLISKDLSDKNFSHIHLDEKQVKFYNLKIKEHSLMQIYSNKKSVLKDL